MEGIEQLVGRTLTHIVQEGDIELEFFTREGDVYKMYHCQDCCESVGIEDIIGDLNDLVGTPILQAEESTNRTDPPSNDSGEDSYTWTFYKLATQKGYVTIRWFGSSNGWYSESVNFDKIEKPIYE